VYITDATSRHEITSWRLDDAPEPAPAVAEGQEGAGTAHFVMVVDMSGSMRKDDIQGYNTRAKAVYECLAKDLVAPQLKQGTQGIKVGIKDMGRLR
jgi:Mg-chelatase subunit ChlD